MKFTKMESYGNDYIYIDAINQKLSNLNTLAKLLSKYHYGIGSDGLVLICSSDKADFKMRIFNKDGTEAQMCGNALRSVGKFVYEHKLTNKTKLEIETLGGIKKIELIIQNDKVIDIVAYIGKPILKSKLIPVKSKNKKFLLERYKILDKEFELSSLSWGNPHTVIFTSDINKLDINKYGPVIETLDIFPEKTNVTFAQIINRKKIKIKEWERGCGETLGCATGCASAVVIANILNLVDNEVDVEQPGGIIKIKYTKKGLYMKGPSNTVFEGTIDVDYLMKGV